MPAPIMAVIGIVMMAGGWYLSKNMETISPSFYEMLHKLEEQGVPFDPGKTISAMGVFFILFPVIRTFYFNPLNEAIDERTNTLDQTFAEAEALRTEMTTMKGDYEKRLAATEASAREQIQAQIKEAQTLRDTLKAEATGQAEEYKKRAIAEIDAEKSKVITELRVRVVNLSLQAAEKVLGESVDNDKNRRLVEEFIDQVEVPA